MATKFTTSRLMVSPHHVGPERKRRKGVGQVTTKLWRKHARVTTVAESGVASVGSDEVRSMIAGAVRREVIFPDECPVIVAVDKCASGDLDRLRGKSWPFGYRGFENFARDTEGRRPAVPLVIDSLDDLVGLIGCFAVFLEQIGQSCLVDEGFPSDIDGCFTLSRACCGAGEFVLCEAEGKTVGWHATRRRRACACYRAIFCRWRGYGIHFARGLDC